MALASTSDPLDPSKPRPLDPNATTALTNPIPNSTMGISALPDGVGGTVSVPPTTLAPTSVLPSSPLTAGTSGQLAGESTVLNFNGGHLTGDSSGLNGTVGSTLPAAQTSTAQQVSDPAAEQRRIDYLNMRAYGGDTDPVLSSQFDQLVSQGKAVAPSGYTSTAAQGTPTLAPTGPNVNLIPGASGTVPTPGTPGAMPTSQPTTFSADQNLINSQINPTGSARLLGAQGQTDSAVAKALNGPDRLGLAKGAYDDFAKLADANLSRGRRDATNAAASHGQVGSGMLTNKYGDLQERFELNDQLARSGFLRDAVEGTIGDRLNNANLARSAESQIYGQEAGARNETRGERDYQQTLAQQAIARRIQQEQLEQSQQAQDFNQGLDLYGLGTRYDPTGAYENAAAMSSAEAGSNSADVAALLRYLAMNRGGY